MFMPFFASLFFSLLPSCSSSFDSIQSAIIEKHCSNGKLVVPKISLFYYIYIRSRLFFLSVLMCTSSPLVFGARLSILWIDLLILCTTTTSSTSSSDDPHSFCFLFFSIPAFWLSLSCWKFSSREKQKKSAFKSISLLEQTNAFPPNPLLSAPTQLSIRQLHQASLFKTIVVCVSCVCLQFPWVTCVLYITIMTMNIMWWNLLTLFAHFHEKCDFQFCFSVENFVFDFWITSQFWRYGFLSNPFHDYSFISLRLNGNPNNSRRESFEQQ